MHQVAFWAVIFYAQRMIGRGTPRYSGSLRLANGLALGVNGFFIALRVVQTHFWYDGLAQDVSIWSSLGSVALMLVWVLLMENPRRGLFFGKKIGFPKRVISVARRYWPRWVRGLVLAAYVAGVLAVYGALGWERLAKVVRIPFIDYAAVFALAGLIGGVLGVIRLLRPPAPRGGPHARRVA